MCIYEYILIYIHMIYDYICMCIRTFIYIYMDTYGVTSGSMIRQLENIMTFSWENLVTFAILLKCACSTVLVRPSESFAVTSFAH